MKTTVRVPDSFINLNLLAEEYNLSLSNYFEDERTQEFIDHLAAEKKVKRQQLTGKKDGNLWVDPCIALHFSSLHLPKIAALVILYAESEEWSRRSTGLENSLIKNMTSVRVFRDLNSTRMIRKQYSLTIGRDCATMVSTPVGIIDILTPTKIIQISILSKWKETIGVLLCLKTFFTEHNLELCLFSAQPVEDQLSDCIEMVCKRYDIELLLWGT